LIGASGRGLVPFPFFYMEYTYDRLSY